MEPLAWCRERMLVPGGALAASLPFAPASCRDAIVALRATISEIAAVPDTVSDIEVGQRKLAWWREALRNRSPHPAIEALVATGAADALAPSEFDALILAVTDTLDAPRFEGREAAWRHCLALGGPAAELEARLVDPDSADGEAWAALGGFAYLVRVVRDLAVDARANRWLAPLDLQAEYQLSRRDVVAGSPGRNWDGLVRAWLDDGLSRVGEALGGRDDAECWRQRHLLVAHALDRRLAARLGRRPARIMTTRVQPGHLGNVWCAWRAARRLRRGAGVIRSR